MVHVIARMNVGGPAEIVTTLVRGLPEQSLLTGSVEQGEEDHLALRAPDLPHAVVPGMGRSVKGAGDARALAFLVRELRRRRPDVVHTHTAKAGVLGRLAARAAGVPSVAHTFHGHLLSGYFSPRVTRAVVTTERALARTTDRLVAVGTQVRDDLLAAGVGRPDQWDVLAPGVSLDVPDRAAARAALGVSGPVVGFIGRLTQVKRPDRLLEVARLLPEVTVLVAGEGPLLEATRAAAPPNVRLLGWRADVATVHAACDVALLTSDNEGMPVSLIEAGLCGTPAVSTDVGSAREVVVGEVCPPSAPALAAAVRRVLAADLREQAQQQARERFGPQRMLDAHARLYAGLEDQGPVSHPARRGP